MRHATRAHVVLAATLALAELSVQAARADLNFGNEHDATYTLGVTDTTAFSDAQLLYNAADTVTASSPGSGSYSVHLLGDSTSLSWTGANGLSVSNLVTTAASASATLTSTGAPGTSGYNYLSNPGQGIISISGGKLFFTAAPLDLTTPATTIVQSIGLQGSWTVSSFTTAPGYGLSFDLNGSNQTIENLVIGSKYSVSNLFTDSGLGFVRFDAVGAGTAVPEPGTTALLAATTACGLGFTARLRRRARR